MAYFIVFGDSVAAGYGAPAGRGFVNDLSCTLKHSRAADQALNFAAGGVTSSDVMTSIAATAPLLSGASFTCMYVGGDDLIQAAPMLVQGHMRNLSAFILQEQKRFDCMLRVLRKYTTRPAIIGSLYNPFPNSQIASEAVATFNGEILVPSANRHQVRIAPIAEAFAGREPGLIDGYSDGVLLHPARSGMAFPIHPNAQGHRVIANAFLSVL